MILYSYTQTIDTVKQGCERNDLLDMAWGETSKWEIVLGGETTKGEK